MRQRNRFIQSKCDRCGKTTPAKQNGIGDLFTLPHEYAELLSDSGDFCVACCERYDEANWLAWFKEHRTETTADATLVAEMSALRAELEAAKQVICEMLSEFSREMRYVPHEQEQRWRRAAGLSEIRE